MTTVLAALHSADSGRAVLSAAIGLADLYDSHVEAVHVGARPSSEVTNLAHAAEIDLREVSGAPIERIVSAAEAAEVAALVLGARAAPGGPRPAARGVRGGPQPAGGTALHVITRIRKAVAVAPPDARPTERIARILVPLEGDGERSRALDEVIGLADRRGVEVLVLHVHSKATVPAFSDHVPHARLVLDQEFLARSLSTEHDNVTVLRRLGVAADDVVTVARETGADLIILTWSQHLGAGRARVVSETLARTDVPVLLLPMQSASAGQHS